MSACLLSFLLVNEPRVEHAPQMLVGWIRIPVGSHQRLEKRYLRPVHPLARQWMDARESIMCGAAIGVPPMQYSLCKFFNIFIGIYKNLTVLMFLTIKNVF